MYENIPAQMREYPNWVCFRFEPDPNRPKPKKVPINPRTGERAASNNPDTWSNFNAALNAAGKYDGLGFMFGNSPFFGVDLDNIEKELRDYVEGDMNIVGEFVDTLQSYTELSPSGAGIHIICRGSLPPKGRRNGNVEMYESGRFFTVTGKRFGDYTEIRENTEQIKPLHEKYIGGSSSEPAERLKPSAPLLLSISEILEIAQKSKNGEKFSKLYSGNYDGYPSQSEADMALCNMLAFWTRRNPEMMDTIFRQSGLMRDKWDRKQSGSTYGALTIAKAIEQCTAEYEPSEKSGYSVVIRGSSAAPVAAKNYSFDDTGNSDRFVDLFGEDMRYNYADKRWLYWDERRWHSDPGHVVLDVIDRVVESMGAELKNYEQQGDEDMAKAFQKHIKYSRSHKGKEQLKKEAEHRLPVMPSQLDKHKYAFNTPNGILSLKTGKLTKHEPKWFITKVSYVEYSENADCPQWHRFLDEIFNGDKELIRYIQKAVGYSMTGQTSEQCVFFLYGTGRNGKSTFLDVIRDIMGDYAANIQPETIMVKHSQSGAINSDIARLKGARFVTSVEPNEGMRINEGLLKQLTGDDVVTARKLYGDEFEFKPEFKLWMATNHKPIIRGTDTGIWRRIHMIPFTVQIPESKVDRGLKYKLEREYPAILRWAVEGCLLWQKEGLLMPKAVLEQVREYRREMDVVSAFIEDRCEAGEGYYVRSSELYAAYSAWCDSNNEYKMSNTKFSTEATKTFSKKKQPDGIYFLGIKLIR